MHCPIFFNKWKLFFYYELGEYSWQDGDTAAMAHMYFLYLTHDFILTHTRVQIHGQI